MLRIIFCAVLLKVACSAVTNGGNTVDNCLEACRSKPAELAFVVDASGSIGRQNFTECLNFIMDVISEFKISDTTVRVSLVTFSDDANAKDAFDLDTYTDKEALKRAISNVPYTGGRTNTAAGITYMLERQMVKARQDARRLAVVITDGNSGDRPATKAAADRAAEAGLDVIALGVGTAISEEELHNIASDDNLVFRVGTYEALEHIKRNLEFKICDQVPVPPCGLDQIDLAFVIDSSSSIWPPDFDTGKTFVNSFIDLFQVNPHSMRVAAITFGNGIYTQDAFQLDQFHDKKHVKEAVSALVHRAGDRTDTGLGIQYMRQTLMSRSRQRASKVCIVLTDGDSHDKQLTANEARLARDEGILMFAVGVGNKVVMTELEAIAGASSRVLTVDYYSNLNVIKDQLTNSTCSEIAQIRGRPKRGSRG